jgi:glycosyltransferase involved in cell wall biosynthesis
LGYNIAIDVTSYLASRTGVGVCVAELMSALLASAGEDKFILCAVSARRNTSILLKQRFPNSEIRVRHVPIRMLSPLVDKSDWPNVETIFGRADVFHASPFLVPASKETAVVTTVYDLTPIRFPEFHLPSNLFTAEQLRRRLDRVHLIIVPSTNTGRDLQDLGLVSSNRVRVIPLAAENCFKRIDRERVEALSKLGLSPGYILNVGALEPRKNLPRLFEAYRILKDRYRITHKLVIVGPRGWKDLNVFDSVHRLDLADSVVFMGYVSNEVLNLLYNHAELLVYPSLYEGFGLPPLEAMAAGCPVAVSKTSSLPEVVGDAGVYFDPLDVEEMAHAIFGILDSHELRAKLIELGMARSLQFSWSKTATETHQAYREAVEIKRRTARLHP